MTKLVCVLSAVSLQLGILVVSTSGFSVEQGHHQRTTEDECLVHGKDPPNIIVQQPWIHAGEKSTISLRCQICAQKPYTVWWTKDGESLGENSARIRQMHNHHHEHPNEYILRIRGVRQKDFGAYECNVYVNGTRLQRSQSLNVSGVPYPAEFDVPTSWSDTTFKLSWKVNCSKSAPIINYKLEFRELPYGDWVVMNIPNNRGSGAKRGHGSKRRKGGGRELIEYSQSYTLKGLSKGSQYQARLRSRNAFGLSAESVLVSFRTYNMGPDEDKNEVEKTQTEILMRGEPEFLGNAVNDATSGRPDVVVPLQRPDYTENNNENKKKQSSVVSSEPLSTRQSQGFAAFSSGPRLDAYLTLLLISMLISSLTLIL